jgi:hypothetical protein
MNSQIVFLFRTLPLPLVGKRVAAQGCTPLLCAPQVGLWGIFLCDDPERYSRHIVVGFNLCGDFNHTGIREAEAINLLRRFYVHENPNAPAPRLKEGRKLRVEVV